MERLDYRLRYLLNRRASGKRAARSSDEDISALTEKAAPRAGEPEVRVLLHFVNDFAELVELGLRVTSRAGDIIAGHVSLDVLERIATHPNVISIEASRPMKDELDVSLDDIGVTELRAVLDASKIPCRGRGVVIGVIDSGFDLTHPCFRDEAGRTRIRFAWDQTIEAGQSGDPPEDFGYGVEYTEEHINEAIRANEILAIANRPPGEFPNPHGTHVTGIAGGNGSSPPPGTFVGVAPEADLILVAYNSEGQLGDSAFALDAACYIVSRARSLDRPVVINLSQGDNFGPHDGTSLLEQALDNLLSAPGVAFVKSAGNERQMKSHASGRVPPGGEYRMEFEVLGLAGATELGAFVPDLEDSFDIWYGSGDRLAVSLQLPDGTRTPAVEPDSVVRMTLPNENELFINSILDHPENADNRITIVLSHGVRQRIETGRWKIILCGRIVTDGGFHAWIDVTKADRDITPTFTRATESCTISTPGTSRRVITVGAFVTKPVPFVNAVKGALMPSSGAGPTRDGFPKPDISAPGLQLVSCALRTADSTTHYTTLMGTSMAAPHVAGVIALLFERNRQLTHDQIKAVLGETASDDSFTGVTPNNSWGSGKLDAPAAYLKLFPPAGAETDSKGEKSMSEYERSREGEEGDQPVRLELLQHDEVRGDSRTSVTFIVRDGRITNVEARDEKGQSYECSVNITLKGKTPDGEDDCWCCPGDRLCFRIPCGTPCPP
jgi:subtilisin family serine protease